MYNKTDWKWVWNIRRNFVDTLYNEKFEHLVESIIHVLIETYFLKGYSTMPKVKMGEKKLINKTEDHNERLRHEIFVNLLKFSKC